MGKLEERGNKGLLITGSHRSGTTWAGKIFNASGKFRMIYEPFNIEISHRTNNYDFKYWYVYYKDVSDILELEECMKMTLQFRYIRSYPPSYNMNFRLRLWLLDYLKNSRDRLFHKLPLVKDPIALYSAEWLAEIFDLNVLVMIRHPLAFAASIKKAQWDFPFDHILKQPLLVERYFADYREEIERYTQETRTPFDQAILLWNLIHTVIHRYRRLRHRNWYFVRHEDMVKQPEAKIQDISTNFGYTVNESMLAELDESLRGNKTSEQKVSYQPRSPALVLSSWKRMLDKQEVDLALERTNGLRQIFYPDDLACFEI